MKNIILATSNYNNAKTGNLVSITGDGGRAWGFNGRAYKKLAPRLETYTPYADKLAYLNELKSNADLYQDYLDYRKKIEDEYIKSYYLTRLKDLNIYNLLEELENRFGNNIILLCHEPINEFCHRRVLADYIELITGTYIPEIIKYDKNYEKVNPIRYKQRLKKIISKIDV